jgi:tetratricopeptide (TPR) repeat protein
METLDNQPFMRLEWVAGEEGRGTDLRGWLRRGPLDLRLALDFTIDICRGLIYANQKQPGIVHRDLKPDNILVSQGRLAKITDFGLALVAQSANLDLADDDAADHLTTHQHTQRAGGAVGTPPYMPPEQWQGGNIDARADIYAVGCILYELLTGQFPYTATTLNGFRSQHEQAPLPTLPHDSDLPSTLNELLSGCLAKRPADRLPSMTDLLNAVTTFYRQQLGEEPRPFPAATAFTAEDYNNRGRTYHDLGRYDEARADFTRAIALDPAYAPAYYNRGRHYDDLKQFEEALNDYNRAIVFDPFYLMMHVNRSATYIDLGRYDEALADCESAIKLDPAFAMTYANRGLVYYNLNHYSEALADCTYAIELDPAYAKAYYTRGLTYNVLGRYKDALADFTKVIALDAEAAEAYANRGLTYRYLESFAEALEDYTRAIVLNPNQASMHYNRGNIYCYLRNFEAALADYTHAIDLEPALAPAYFNRGSAYYNLERYEDALIDFEKAAQFGEPKGSEYAILVRQHLMGGSVNPAEQAFETLLDADSMDEVWQAVRQFPFMTGQEFIQMVEQTIVQQIPPDERLPYEQRLAALRQIADEQA